MKETYTSYQADDTFIMPVLSFSSSSLEFPDVDRTQFAWRDDYAGIAASFTIRFPSDSADRRYRHIDVSLRRENNLYELVEELGKTSIELAADPSVASQEVRCVIPLDAPLDPETEYVVLVSVRRGRSAPLGLCRRPLLLRDVPEGVKELFCPMLAGICDGLDDDNVFANYHDREEAIRVDMPGDDFSDPVEQIPFRQPPFSPHAMFVLRDDSDCLMDLESFIIYHYPDGSRVRTGASFWNDYSGLMPKELPDFNGHNDFVSVEAAEPSNMYPCGPVYIELEMLGERIAGFVVEKVLPEEELATGFFYGEGLELRDYTPRDGNDILKQRKRSLSAALSRSGFDTLLDAAFAEADADGAVKPVSAIDGLNAMVGLEEVKKAVRSYMNVMCFHRLRTERGISTRMPPLHSLFLGSPGTGKTTVAKAMGRLMKEAGVLSSGHVVATERAKIIGKHYGDESKAMLEAIEKAEGGVLFIDEAYSFYREADPKDPGREAIETLMTALADDSRRNWMVILGGYEEPMMRMLKMNPGLESRFPHNNRYRFADYTAEELLEIARGFCRANSYTLSEGAAEVLLQRLRNDVAHKNDGFGNARHVLNILETEVIPAMATRAASLTDPSDSQLMEICASDVAPASISSPGATRTKLGFCA